MNQPLVLVNQKGEESINTVKGTGAGNWLPIPGNGRQLFGNGATTPVDGTSGTGHGIAAKGSLYTALDTGVLYVNTGTITSPVWSAAGTTTNGAIIAATLTGLTIGAGTVSASDTVLSAFQKLAALNNGTPTPISETVSAAGAISTTKMLSILANGTGGSYAATLAAPSSQDGQLKVLKMTTATHTVTLAMTNIAMSGGYTPTGTATLTFTATGDSAVLMAVGAKWVYLGGTAVAS